MYHKMGGLFNHMVIGILTVFMLLIASCSLIDNGSNDPVTPPQREAKHVILIIGDGSQLAHEISASRYLFGTDNGLTYHSFPYQAYVSTWDVTTYDRYAWNLGRSQYSADTFDPLVGFDPAKGGSAPWPAIGNIPDQDYYLNMIPYWGDDDATKTIATDSASSATAMACGIKTDAGNIAWLPGDEDDGAVKTIAELYREQYGAAIGTVSTVQFNHATPASFISHNVYRSNYTELAHEIVTEVRPDVVIGGGSPSTRGEKNISTDDYNLIRTDPEYVFVDRIDGTNGGDRLLAAADQAVAEGKKLFALFGGSGGNMEPPIPVDGSVSFDIDETDPQLLESSLAALRVLSQNENGFFLMIEQGDLDWANHANDYAWMVGTTWDLNETVKTVMNFIDLPGDDINWANTMVIVTHDHSNSYMRYHENLGQGNLPTQLVNPNPDTEMGHSGYRWPYIPDYLYPDGDITYSSDYHTNEPVTLYAIGAGLGLLEHYEGSWYSGTRILDDTQIFEAMADFLELD